MKKVFVLLMVVAFGMVLFSSCKSADCPAYAQTDAIEVEQGA